MCEGKGGRLKVRERVGGVVRVRCEKGGRELSERRLKRREKGKKRKREREKKERKRKEQNKAQSPDFYFLSVTNEKRGYVEWCSLERESEGAGKKEGTS